MVSIQPEEFPGGVVPGVGQVGVLLFRGYAELVNIQPLAPDVEAIDEITEDDIPIGNTKEDRRRRQDLIYAFYMGWKRKNPEQKKYNIALQDDINIRAVSLDQYIVKNLETV